MDIQAFAVPLITVGLLASLLPWRNAFVKLSASTGIQENHELIDQLC